MISKTIVLQPPLLTESHINEKISCVRAHRERIFFTQSQLYKNKIIFHNYGQGGAGYTFLFGCVQRSMEQFDAYYAYANKDLPVAVIGAGCYGLLTAIEIARRNIPVRIIAKDFDAITSYKAAGFFFPRSRKSSTQQEKEQFLSCGITSYTTYMDIIAQRHPFLSAGARLLPAYYHPFIDPGLNDYCKRGLMNDPQPVSIDFGNGKQHHAMAYQTLFVDAQQLMQQQWTTVHNLKIPVHKQLITTFEEVPESVIFNCTGLGAQHLTKDPLIIPVQGHLITLRNQEIQQLQYLINWQLTQMHPRGYERNELLYFAPKNDGILGITFLRNQDGTKLNSHEFDRLLERAHLFFGEKP